MTVTEYQRTLRGLAVRDDKLVRRALSSDKANRNASHLDRKTYAFVRLSAMISVGAPVQSLRPIVEAAQEAGATPEEIVGTLLAVMPVTGVPRIVAAAPSIGLSIGYDVFNALERHEQTPATRPRARTKKEAR
jgi:alkylhydroperoxidase/carboxymuconolactone decarboxylase family protein YurZ